MRKLILAVVLLSISCADLCGCSPQPDLVYVRGTLQSNAGAPLSGKRVRAELASRSCESFQDAYSSSVSGPDGRVLLSVSSLGSPVDSTCVRLFARDTLVGAMESPVGSPFLVKTGYFPYDTIDVSMVLAPTIR